MVISTMADDFTEADGIGSGTASKLREAGYESWKAILFASEQTLQDKADIGEKMAQKLTKAARDKEGADEFETGIERREDRQNIDDITTGVPALDELIGGGIKTKSIFETYGEFGTGKSQITHQMCVNVQLPKEHGGAHGRAIFIDTEDSFRTDRIEEMTRGLDDDKKEALMEAHGVETEDALVEEVLNHIHVSPAHNSNHQIVLTEKASSLADQFKDDDFPVKVFCVDSLMAHFRAEYVGRGSLADRQQKLSKHLYDMKRFINLYNASVIVTNQVQSDPDSFFGDPTKPIGGNILGHTSNYRLYLKKKKDPLRAAKLVDSPALPEGEALFSITEEGIKPE